MQAQEIIDFRRVEQAIHYIRNNFHAQPGLYEIAEEINVSPFHFQRLFSDWAGTSPKKFLQYISIQHAKTLLRESKASLFETSAKTGLSTSSRLHDLFINIEGMTPGEYKNGGANLEIKFQYASTLFGDIIVASTDKGICYLAFFSDAEEALRVLQGKFPNAAFKQQDDPLQERALKIFRNDWNDMEKIRLHLKGTDFQLKIWETLLQIPQGNLCTYGQISTQITNAGASRAVGTAIGANPVAFLIPCHRVIQSTGIFGGYRWGSNRKTAMIGWEAAQADQQKLMKIPPDSTLTFETDIRENR